MSFWKKLFTQEKKDEVITQEQESLQEQNDLAQTKLFVLDKKLKAPKQALPAVLNVISGPDAGKQVNFASKQVNIGRLPGSELHLQDVGASRLHAFIVHEEGQHVLYDGKSMNGTYVNNQRVTKKILADGDSIKIANTVIVYELQ